MNEYGKGAFSSMTASNFFKKISTILFDKKNELQIFFLTAAHKTVLIWFTKVYPM